MDRRLIPTNRRFVVAIRIRAFSLALFLGLACGLPARADSLTSLDGWNWFVSNASGSALSSPPLPQTFGPVTNAANAANATTAPTLAPAPTSQPSSGGANAFINFGAGPYPDGNWIASGNPQAWYNSPEVAALFGGTPTAAQQTAFTSTVLQLTEQTFSKSGISVNLTTNPSVPAAHTLSVVSNSSSVPFPSAIGTTQLGGSGFSFIDQEAQVSSSVGQLELILAHNIAHELMLAFGVPEKYDQTGNYIDATNANWSMITNPNATFSPAAAQAINQALQSANSAGGDSSLAQYVNLHPAPEPATFVAWGFGLLALAAGPRLRRKRHGAG
jgi:MYXO-CTERM domain-containing protein